MSGGDVSIAVLPTREERASGPVARKAPRLSVVDVSVVIPTFRRPDSLARALGSCQEQLGAPRTEIVVVDNCPHGSAYDVVSSIARSSSLPIRYEQEPIAGVAAARNRGVRTARAPLLAFLDDDEEAHPGWLAKLIEARAEHDADAVFGAVLPQFDGLPPRGAAAYLPMLRRLFPEPPGELPRRRLARLGTGNSLFHARCLGERPFDPGLGLGGGEDSALIKRLARERRRFIWSPEARVTEYLPAERANLRFLLRRRFSDGQVRTSTCLVTGPREPGRALFWMAVGAVQVGVWGALAACTSLVRPDLAGRCLCNAGSGLGKVLWMPPFRVLRYPTQEARESLEGG